MQYIKLCKNTSVGEMLIFALKSYYKSVKLMLVTVYN